MKESYQELKELYGFDDEELDILLENDDEEKV